MSDFGIRPELPTTSDAYDAVQDSGRPYGEHGNNPANQSGGQARQNQSPVWDDNLNRWRPPGWHLPADSSQRGPATGSLVPSPASGNTDSPEAHASVPVPYPVSPQDAFLAVVQNVTRQVVAVQTTAESVARQSSPRRSQTEREDQRSRPPLPPRVNHSGQLEDVERAFIRDSRRLPQRGGTPPSTLPMNAARNSIPLSDVVRERQAMQQPAARSRTPAAPVSTSDVVRERRSAALNVQIEKQRSQPNDPLKPLLETATKKITTDSQKALVKNYVAAPIGGAIPTVVQNFFSLIPQAPRLLTSFSPLPIFEKIPDPYQMFITVGKTISAVPVTVSTTLNKLNGARSNLVSTSVRMGQTVASAYAHRGFNGVLWTARQTGENLLERAWSNPNFKSIAADILKIDLKFQTPLGDQAISIIPKTVKSPFLNSVEFTKGPVVDIFFFSLDGKITAKEIARSWISKGLAVFAGPAALPAEIVLNTIFDAAIKQLEESARKNEFCFRLNAALDSASLDLGKFAVVLSSQDGRSLLAQGLKDDMNPFLGMGLDPATANQMFDRSLRFMPTLAPVYISYGVFNNWTKAGTGMTLPEKVYEFYTCASEGVSRMWDGALNFITSPFQTGERAGGGWSESQSHRQGGSW